MKCDCPVMTDVMGRTVAGQQRNPWIELGRILFLASPIHFHIFEKGPARAREGLRGEMNRHAKSRETWMGLDVLALS